MKKAENSTISFPDNILETADITKIFPIQGSDGFTALKNVTIKVPKNSLTILKGRSGSGKTTLINILGALDQPTKGSVFLDGEEITRLSEARREKIRRCEIGFIFQSVSLIPMMTAYENVEFALRLAGIKENHKSRVEACLKMVGLEGRMHHMPAELSGGEQQRVAVARAVAHKPKIIFADEPTAELDTASSVMVVNLFKEMVEKEGVTIIMTTHDSSLMGAGDYLFELEDGEIVHE